MFGSSFSSGATKLMIHQSVSTNIKLEFIDLIIIRDETGPMQNWLKCAETSCNCGICMAVPE